MNKKILAFIIIIALIVIALFAINSVLKKDVEESEVTPEEVIVPSVSAPDQAGGMEVFINEVVLLDGGYVAIHREFDGVASTTIGVSGFLPAGTATNFLISLDEEVVEGDMLFAMLHVDDGDGLWSIELDTHLNDAGGAVIGQTFAIVDEGALDDEVKL